VFVEEDDLNALAATLHCEATDVAPGYVRGKRAHSKIRRFFGLLLGKRSRIDEAHNHLAPPRFPARNDGGDRR
jgi:hypothetical protein